MAKKPTINKRILRCEYWEIVTEAYAPDWETQARFTPGPLIETLHQYVVDYMDEHSVLRGKDQGKGIKKRVFTGHC